MTSYNFAGTLSEAAFLAYTLLALALACGRQTRGQWARGGPSYDWQVRGGPSFG